MTNHQVFYSVSSLCRPALVLPARCSLKLGLLVSLRSPPPSPEPAQLSPSERQTSPCPLISYCSYLSALPSQALPLGLLLDLPWTLASTAQLLWRLRLLPGSERIQQSPELRLLAQRRWDVCQ